MTTHRVRIQVAGSAGNFELDGQPIHGVRAATLSMGVRQIPTLTLDLAVLEFVEAEVEQARVFITPEVHDLLVRHGWTPPK